MARVLLIEDDAEAGDAFKGMLEVLGHTVTWVLNGKIAVRHLEQQKETPGPSPIELIVTDIVMPEMDGLEFLRYLRKNHPGTRCVATSGRIETPYLDVAKQFGASMVLKKPFTIKELDAAIQHALSNPPGT